MLKSEITLLNERIVHIESENFNIHSETQVKFEQIVEVSPSDYQAVKSELRNFSQKNQILQQRCSTLERLLLFGEVSNVPHVVHDFKAMAQFYLLQLAKEIEIYRFCPEEREELLEFVKYLHSVTQEIEDMLIVVKE